MHDMTLAPEHKQHVCICVSITIILPPLLVLPALFEMYKNGSGLCVFLFTFAPFPPFFIHLPFLPLGYIQQWHCNIPSSCY